MNDVSLAILNVTKDMMGRIERIQERAVAYEKLTAEGFDVKFDRYSLMYGPPIHVKRDQLPLIRKVCGRVKVTDKNISSDYDTTGEIQVTIRPMAKEFNCVEFSYRTPLRGHKCQVETVTNNSSYKTLVCKS